VKGRPGVIRTAEEMGKVDHVGLAVHSIADCWNLYESLLGGTFREGGDVGTDFRAAQVVLPGGLTVELMEPIGQSGRLADFISEHGPGLHHIAVRSQDVRASAAAAARVGYRVVGENLAEAGWREAYIHPSSAGGVLIQLFDSAKPAPDGSCDYDIDDVLSGQLMWSAGEYIRKDVGQPHAPQHGSGVGTPSGTSRRAARKEELNEAN